MPAARLLVIVAMVGLAGCGGTGGSSGAPPPPGAVTPIADADEIIASISSVRIKDGTELRFRLRDGADRPVVGLPAGAVSFVLARLTPAANGEPGAWQSYINVTEMPGGAGPGTTNRQQAATENGSAGQFTDHGDGSYSYRFATDVRAVPGVPFEPGQTHRAGLEIRNYVPVANPVYDFRPADGARTGLAAREIVSDGKCNICHEQIAEHGSARFEHQYCVTCHNPGSADANSGNTIDETVMIHKIHMGADLPSVRAGGEYVLYGFRNSRNDYSDVVYPQDIRNCRGCHDEGDPATPQAANWYLAPTIAGCGSCHDDIDFATGANHANGVAAANAECAVCHGSGELRADAAHRQLELLAAGAFRFNLLGISDTGTGQLPGVRFSVTNPRAGNAPYDIKTNPAFTGSASVGINLAWPTSGISNPGTGGSATGTPAQPVRISAITAALANGDGSYTARSTVPVPAAVTGSGIVSLEGRTSVDVNGDGAAERIPVAGVSGAFAITDPVPVPRRAIATLSGCQDCHQALVFHGANRTDDLENCAGCHNANVTDIQRRQQGGVTAATAPDGLREASLELGYMSHALHAGTDRAQAYVVYDRSGSPVSFGTVGYPGRLANCTGCHVPGSYYPVTRPLPGLTIDTGASRQDPLDDLRITPTTAACAGCHDDAAARGHMEDAGGAFDALQAADGTFTSLSRGTVVEDCAGCHGPGADNDVATEHALP